MSIQSFDCPDTEALFRSGRCARFANIAKVATRKLQMLDSATTIGFMRMPPGNDLKEYGGVWHVRINDQWRLTFSWGDAGPAKVRIEDPH
ncbi:MULTISPECIES: type II toxin-antitoxin system RelE/ParE family toxin [unclassified Variovorax]|uniref:type II toxin-antitoxin system RelE/ParE family toxin n=1 Tax=unclassified Variovorax TaxID=663243 RepID=UPI001BD59361|nr:MULTISPECIES: type II toxin-antitoxin system RelE/ParE family toxin [unclassified Variovorax]